MGRIDWDDSFSVGNEELDKQHQRLIQLYNNLHESLLHGTLEEATEQRKNTLAELIKYIDYHFKFEEQFMRKIDYVNVEKHCRIHCNFVRKVTSLQKDIANGEMFFTSSLIKLLRNWIVEHILNEDKAYSLQLK